MCRWIRWKRAVYVGTYALRFYALANAEAQYIGRIYEARPRLMQIVAKRQMENQPKNLPAASQCTHTNFVMTKNQITSPCVCVRLVTDRRSPE